MQQRSNATHIVSTNLWTGIHHRYQYPLQSNSRGYFHQTFTSSVHVLTTRLWWESSWLSASLGSLHITSDYGVWFFRVWWFGVMMETSSTAYHLSARDKWQSTHLASFMPPCLYTATSSQKATSDRHNQLPYPSTMHSLLLILGFTLVSVSAHALNVKRDLTVSTDLPSAWSSSGCYSDIRSARALTAGYTSSSQMTEIMCIEYCDQKGFSYAGVEYGQECYCGYGVSNNQYSIDSSRCNMACPGSPSTPCGGPDAINIFTNGHAGPVENPGVLNYVSLGCYSDSQSARTLDTFKPSSDGITFVLGCIEVCSGAGYQYAGLEYRQVSHFLHRNL